MAKRPQAAAYDRVVGGRVRRLREQQGLSMAELAARVEPATTDSQINKLEKGIVKMTVQWLYRLGDALGVHPLDLIEPVPKLSPREQALVDLYRGLDERGQDTVWRVADALPKSDVSDDGAGGGGG